MKVLYQHLGLDPGRLTAVVHRLLEVRVEGVSLVAAVVGDLSCLRRCQWLLDRLGRSALRELRATLGERGVTLLLQLPLVIKESELDAAQELVTRWGRAFGGYVTGDLGMLSWLDGRAGVGGGVDPSRLVYTSNVVNPSFSQWLRERFDLWRVRPLMHKRTFIEEPVGYAKDVVVYGNMVLNCSTFCLHSGDLPDRCTLTCGQPRPMLMEGEGERVYLLGRSLVTRRRLDLRPRVSRIADLRSVTLMDLDLSLDELAAVYRSLGGAAGSAGGPGSDALRP